MVALKTSSELLDLLAAAARRKPTSDEIERQRVSFIMSTVKENSDVTVSRIKEVLADQDGNKRT